MLFLSQEHPRIFADALGNNPHSEAELKDLRGTLHFVQDDKSI